MNRFTDTPFTHTLSKVAMVFCFVLGLVATAQALPQEATDVDMKTCKFISRVSGNSGYGKNNDWKGAAKIAALKQAEGLGASDVVWGRYSPVGAFNGQVDGKVYVCGDSHAPIQASINHQ